MNTERGREKDTEHTSGDRNRQWINSGEEGKERWPDTEQMRRDKVKRR